VRTAARCGADGTARTAAAGRTTTKDVDVDVSDPWDLLVVGGGTAGIVAAKTAASLGARVALVERARTGGDCLWTGCVPSKALLAAAARAAQARSAASLGVRVTGVEVDFEAVMEHVHGAVAAIEPVDSVQALQAAGVHVLTGTGRFTRPAVLAVDGVEHRFRRALVATGASPAVPPVAGLARARPLTSDTVWDLPALPARLVVLGGGSVGCELGQAFARLGSTVTLVEAMPRLLPREDPDAAALVQAQLAVDGVEVLVGRQALSVSTAAPDAPDPGSPGGPGRLVVAWGDERRTLQFDALMVAVGRRPRSDGIGLEAVGVEVDRQGFVVVDERLRTTNARIFAAGDVTAHPQFTHVAGVHGSLAATNAVLGLRRRVDVAAIPRVTYTDPEVAAVGRATWADESDGTTPRVVTRLHADVDRAVTDGRTDGFARLALGRDGTTLVGATVVGPRAGESLAELTLAVRRGLSTSDLAGTMHAYPTYGDGPWHAAIARAQQRLAEPRLRAVTGALVRVRRALTWRP
jgi:pyruvate/2-oxoglutarate dehydrogenase complex dihydrolipoamide dehydrogenase (E3) component